MILCNADGSLKFLYPYIADVNDHMDCNRFMGFRRNCLFNKPTIIYFPSVRFQHILFYFQYISTINCALSFNNLQGK